MPKLLRRITMAILVLVSLGSSVCWIYSHYGWYRYVYLKPLSYKPVTATQPRTDLVHEMWEFEAEMSRGFITCEWYQFMYYIEESRFYTDRPLHIWSHMPHAGLQGRFNHLPQPWFGFDFYSPYYYRKAPGDVIGIRISLRFFSIVPLVLLSLFFITPTWRWWKKKSARKIGCCRVCGYDLRATPYRCPECGTIVHW